MPRYGFGRSGILNFGEFRGATRNLVLANLAAYFLFALLGLASARGYMLLFGVFALTPATLLHGWLWQLVTYPFLHIGILNTAFELLSLWFLGNFLEAQHGARWLVELFFISAIGAGLASVLMGLLMHNPYGPLYGCWGAIFGLLIAFGVLYAETEFMMFPLPITIKAKYLVAVYLLIALAMLFSTSRVFALAQLGGALFGYLYIRFAPRRGLTGAGRSQYFDLRNRYYRWKRRQAAKKFEVYMSKQNRDLNAKNPSDHDPDDRSRWN